MLVEKFTLKKKLSKDSWFNALLIDLHHTGCHINGYFVTKLMPNLWKHGNSSVMVQRVYSFTWGFSSKTMKTEDAVQWYCTFSSQLAKHRALGLPNVIWYRQVEKKGKTAGRQLGLDFCFDTHSQKVTLTSMYCACALECASVTCWSPPLPDVPGLEKARHRALTLSALSGLEREPEHILMMTKLYDCHIYILKDQGGKLKVGLICLRN